MCFHFLLSDAPFTLRLLSLDSRRVKNHRIKAIDARCVWEIAGRVFHGNHFTLRDDQPFNFKTQSVLLNMIHAHASSLAKQHFKMLIDSCTLFTLSLINIPVKQKYSNFSR